MCTNVIIESKDDPRINFTFMKKDDILNFHNNPDILYTDCLNYGIKVKDGENTHNGLDDIVPLDFFGIDNIVDGKAWFKQKYPQLPEEYWEIMAKYQFDEPFTKKQLKNAVKNVARISSPPSTPTCTTSATKRFQIIPFGFGARF